jgi:hypothetical protein
MEHSGYLLDLRTAGLTSLGPLSMVEGGPGGHRAKNARALIALRPTQVYNCWRSEEWWVWPRWKGMPNSGSTDAATVRTESGLVTLGTHLEEVSDGDAG